MRGRYQRLRENNASRAGDAGAGLELHARAADAGAARLGVATVTLQSLRRGQAKPSTSDELLSKDGAVVGSLISEVARQPHRLRP